MIPFVQIPILLVSIWMHLLWILNWFIDPSVSTKCHCHLLLLIYTTSVGSVCYTNTMASRHRLAQTLEYKRVHQLSRCSKLHSIRTRFLCVIDSWWSNHDLVYLWCVFAHIQTIEWSSLIHLRKRKCHVFNTFLAGYAGSCQNYNFRYNQGWLVTWPFLVLPWST